MCDSSKANLEQKLIIEGALGFKWDIRCENNLKRILHIRKLAATRLIRVPHDSKTGKEYWYIINFCNSDIEKLLVL